MSSSKVVIKLSDQNVSNFYTMFGGAANLSRTMDTLLTILLDEAEMYPNEDVETIIQNIRERLA